MARIKYPANASTVMKGIDIKLQAKGKIPPTVWVDIQQAYRYRSERTGYPTQKPLKLLQRIIEASSNEKDIVLDPFCGCATTCVTAEKLNRRWIGIDISVKAYDLVRKRMIKEVSNMFNTDKIGYTTVPPKRTDQGKSHVDEKYVYIAVNSDNTRLKDLFKVGVSLTPKDRPSSAFDPFGSNKIVYEVKKENYRETERYIHNKYPRIKEWVVGADLETLKKEINEYDYKEPEQLGIV